MIRRLVVLIRRNWTWGAECCSILEFIHFNDEWQGLVVLQFQPLFHGSLLVWVSSAVSKADLQEKATEIEADEAFWNTRIVPILHELEKGKKKIQSLF